MVAAANIAAAREQYRIQRADQFPASRRQRRRDRSPATSSGSGVDAEYQAGVGITSFELDLFGRLRSLTNAELNRYFATEAGGARDPARAGRATSPTPG